MIEIYQGGNTPIIIEIEDDTMPIFTDLSASLYIDRLGELKHWSMEEMEIDGNQIILSMEQEETIRYPQGIAILSLKGSDEGDNVILYDEVAVEIKYKFDKTIVRGDADESGSTE